MGLDKRKLLPLIFLIVIIIAIPLTVFIAQKSQDIRQRAAENSNISQKQDSRDPRPLGYIVELKDDPLIRKKTGRGQVLDLSIKPTLEDQHKKAKDDILSRLKGQRGVLSAPEGTPEIKVLNEYYSVFNGFALDITKEQAEKIKRESPFVKDIYENLPVKANLADSVPLIKADQVWQTTDGGGNPNDGRGQTIAVIDSGIDYTHPDLGGSQVSDRPFTRVAFQDNYLSNFIDQAFSLNNNRIAYALGNEIKIVNLSNLNSDQTIVSLDPDRQVIRIVLHNNILAYFASAPDLITSLYFFDLRTGKHRKIADTQVVREIAVTAGKVLYAKSTFTYDGTSSGQEGLFSYDSLTDEEIPIEPLAPADNIRFMYGPQASRNLVVYDLPNNDPGRTNDCPKKAVLYDLNSKTKREVEPPFLGPILDFKGDKFLYVGCYDYTNLNHYYLYDITTNQVQYIPAQEGDTSGVPSAVKNTRDVVSFINKGAIGDNIIFFSFDQRSHITAYDFNTQKYAQINLYTLSNSIQAEGKTVCFSGEDVYIYCHTYDSTSSYELPQNIFNVKVVGGYNFVSNNNDPYDDMGHGTHVSAIAAGLSNPVSNQALAGGGRPSPTPLAPYLGGVAPGSKLIAYKVLDSWGNGYESSIIAAIEKAVEDRVDVISMSLGADCLRWYGGYTSYCGPDDPGSFAVDRAVDAGITVVVAAGNSGSNFGTINSPGTARKAITVGAVDKDKNIAKFSSRGPVSISGETIIKPDVLAPGVNICAAERKNWISGRRCRDDRHIAIDGTSMATPHVAGVAAFLHQKHPDWLPSQIKSAIMTSASDLNLHANEQGGGFVDALGAIAADPPSPTPTFTPTPTPLLFPQTFRISKGWSLVGITVDKGQEYYAEDFLRNLNSNISYGSTALGRLSTDIRPQGGAQIEQIYRYVNGMYEGHSIGGRENNNFPIRPGEAYFVKSRETVNTSLTGQEASLGSLSIVTGWNLFSLPQTTSLNTASALIQALNQQGIVARELFRWKDGRWSVYIKDTPLDFTLTPGEGYFIRNTSSEKVFNLP